MVEELIPIVLFLCIFLGVAISQYFKHLSEKERQNTLRLLIEKGGELTPEVIATLSTPKSKNKPLWYGAILIAAGLGGMSLGAFSLGNSHVIWGNAIPLLMGVSLVLVWKYTNKKEQ